MLSALSEYVKRESKVPYQWHLVTFTTQLREQLAFSKIALGWETDPLSGPDWACFIVEYLSKMGSSLDDNLKPLDGLVISAANTLNLPSLQTSLVKLLVSLRTAVLTSSQDSLDRPDARRLYVAALSKRVPHQLGSRVYHLLGIPPTGNPSVDLTLADIETKVHQALVEVFNELAKDSKTAEVFKVSDGKLLKDKSVGAPAPAPAPAPPKGTPAAKSSNSRAPAASPAPAPSPALAPVPAAGAGGSKPAKGTPSTPASPLKDGRKSPCFNCGGEHWASQCRKPCKFYAAGNCVKGRACPCGPVVPDKHGDDRSSNKKPAPATE